MPEDLRRLGETTNRINKRYDDNASGGVDSIDPDAIGTSELDLSITPTWTGEHTFAGDITTDDARIDVTAESDDIFAIRANIRSNSSSRWPLKVSSSEGELLTVQAMGQVNVKKSDLRLDTGQAIEDGSGNNRFSIDDDRTVVRDDAAVPAFYATRNDAYVIRPGSGDEVFKIEDAKGSFDAVTYTPTSSAPGTLELTNAELQMLDNRIRWDAGGSDFYGDTISIISGDVGGMSNRATTSRLIGDGYTDLVRIDDISIVAVHGKGEDSVAGRYGAIVIAISSSGSGPGVQVVAEQQKNHPNVDYQIDDDDSGNWLQATTQDDSERTRLSAHTIAGNP